MIKAGALWRRTVVEDHPILAPLFFVPRIIAWRLNKKKKKEDKKKRIPFLIWVNRFEIR